MFKLLSKIKLYMNNIKIRNKLLWIYFIAGIIPILIIGIYLICVTRNLVMQEHISQIELENVRVKNIIFNTTNSLSNISNDIFNDYELKGIVSTQYKSKEDCYNAYRNYIKLTNYKQKYSEIRSITLYISNPTMCDYECFKTVDQEIMQSDWYIRALDSVNEVFWVTSQTMDNSKNFSNALTLIRKIPIFNSNETAVLRICVSNNYLNMLINNSSLKTEMCVNGYPVFYTNMTRNNDKSFGAYVDENKKYYDFIGIDYYDKEKVLLNISTLHSSEIINQNNSIYIATIDRNAISDKQNIVMLCIGILFFSLLVPLIMIIFFSNTFSDRINLLRSEMHRVSKGDYNIIQQFNGNDEVYELFLDLQATIIEIKELDAEIYNQKLAKEQLINHQQKIEFEMLSNQINPHFLYNTLESIRMKAHSVGDNEVATAIKLLGKSMRHTLEVTGKPTSLSSEFEYIKTYLEIQKFRFKEKIQYELKVNPEIDAEKYLILPLLIQPVVENSISHGLEDIETGGFISINVKNDLQYLYIIISDNGCGMNTEKLSELIEKISIKNINDSKSSIGLQNINQRIKLYYGNNYGLDIKSHLNTGTVVQIKLPINFEGEL